MNPSRLIKDAKVDVGYYADDYVQDRVTAIATFRTAQGKHKTWMRFPMQMIESMTSDELSNMMVAKLNEFIHRDLFGRAFNMAKRLKHGN